MRLRGQWPLGDSNPDAFRHKILNPVGLTPTQFGVIAGVAESPAQPAVARLITHFCGRAMPGAKHPS